MDFLEKLEKIKQENNFKSNMELSKACGVPYTTIDGFYKKGYENAKISTLKKIANSFNVSLDWLVLDRYIDDYSQTEKQLINSWRKADEYSKSVAAFALGFNYETENEKNA